MADAHPSNMPPRQPSTAGISTTTTIALLFILFLALFPDLFHLIWTLPLSLIGRATHFSSEPQPTLQPSLLSLIHI